MQWGGGPKLLLCLPPPRLMGWGSCRAPFSWAVALGPQACLAESSPGAWPPQISLCLSFPW